MKDEPQNPYKLNILALPNQTTILFGLIVVVFIGSIIAGSFGAQPFIWLLTLGFLFLPLRAFLAWPDRELRQHKLADVGNEFSDLIKVIQEEAATIPLTRVPKLVISESNIELHIFGSWRRWYITISRDQALGLKADLNDPDRIAAVHALILHELYHFKNGDYWQMGYARELLRTAAVFMTWAIIFLLGYGFFLLLIQPEFLRFDFSTLANQIKTLPPEFKDLYSSLFPSAREWAEVQEKAAKIDLRFVIYFIANATLPFIIISTFLWSFYYRKLLRIREIYADAGAIQTQKAVDDLFSAFLLGSRVRTDPKETSRTSFISIVKHSIETILQRSSVSLTLPKLVKGWFRSHPDFQRRVDALEDPVAAYDRWFVTALLLGSLALLLEILLSTPLMLPYQGQWPLHFSVLVVSVVVTLALMTPLVLGKPTWSPMLKIIGVVVALRLVWLILTIILMILLLIMVPDIFTEIVTSAIVSIARYSRPLTGPIFDDPQAFVIKASQVNIAQVFIVLVSLVLLISVNILLLRRLFTWYSFPQGKRLMKAAYGTIAITTTFFGLSILTLVTTVLLRPTELLDPLIIIRELLGLIIAVVGLGLFEYANRKYARRCPNCCTSIDGLYHLGRHCEACGELLHPWLIAEYES